MFFSSQLENLPQHLEQARAGGFKLVIIDTPPQATGLIRAVVGLADLVLIPDPALAGRPRRGRPHHRHRR